MESNTPSETDFWVHHVEALEKCNICLEPFNQTHTALRFTGKDACPHIFGDICLRAWSETASRNANKCPICRRILWKSDDPNDITNATDELEDEDFGEEESSLDYPGDALDDNLWHLLADLENASLQLNSISGESDSGYDSDAASAGADDSVSLRSFYSFVAEISDALHVGDERAISQLLESGRSRDTGVDLAQDMDWEEVLDIADEHLHSELSDRLQADDEPADDEAMSQFTTSVLNLDDSENEFVAPEDAHIQTIALSDCNRATIDELVDNFFHATEPSDSMPVDADVTHIRKRMEHCVDLVLEEAGYKQPFLIDPGPMDAMVEQFRGMVIYRRIYVVSNAYTRWWKDVMMSHINGKGTRAFHGLA